MSEEMKRLLKEELKKDADNIMRETEEDPNVENVKATPELRNKIFEEIRQYEKEQTYKNLPEEYRELVELGKVYKKKKKNRKYLVLAAALVLAMSVGVTSMGGPERIFKEIRWAIGGREQVNVDSDSDRVVKPEVSSEEEAYQEVQDKLGFEPVRMDYMPEGMEFVEFILNENMKTAQFNYHGRNSESIVYRVKANYRQGSVGFDVEDQLVDKFTVYQNDTAIDAKEYLIKDTDDRRWIVRFEYKNVQYFMMINGIKKAGIEKILKNLYFL